MRGWKKNSFCWKDEEKKMRKVLKEARMVAGMHNF